MSGTPARQTSQTHPSGNGAQRTTTYDAMPRAMVVTTRAVLSDTREMLSDTFRPSVIRRQLTRMPETLHPTNVAHNSAHFARLGYAAVASARNKARTIAWRVLSGGKIAPAPDAPADRAASRPRSLQREETIKGRSEIMHRLHHSAGKNRLGRAAARATNKTWTSEWQREMHDEPSTVTVRKSLAAVGVRAKEERHARLRVRKLRRFNAMARLRLVVHTAGEGGEASERQMLLEVEDSLYHNQLTKRLQDTLGFKPRLLWLDESGEAHELSSQRDFAAWLDHNWCTLPWVLHACEASASSIGRIELHERAKALFVHYDVSNDGRIDQSELRRMIKDLGALDELRLSDELLDRFLRSEFHHIDVDRSGKLDLEEFTHYVANMACFRRDELIATNKQLVAQVAARAAVETRTPIAPLPPPTTDAEGRKLSILETQRFGVRVEVLGQLPHVEGTQFAVATRALQRVIHLAEADHAPRGEFGTSTPAHAAFQPSASAATLPPPSFLSMFLVPCPCSLPLVGRPAFTPIVEVSAYDSAGRPLPEEALFSVPVTLEMPHAFCPSEGLESVVMLAAPPNAKQWHRIQLDVAAVAAGEEDGGGEGAGELFNGDAEAKQSPVSLHGGVLRCSLPHPGIYCAFSSPEVEDICQVRMVILALSEVPRFMPTTIRVHLVPELPDHIAEMMALETAEWGSTAVVGESHLMSLCEGATLALRFQGQEDTIVWHGTRTSVEFTFVPPPPWPSAADKGSGRGGKASSSPSSAAHALRPTTFEESLLVDVVHGTTRRAMRVESVARRAGLSAVDHEVPISLKVSATDRPAAPASFELAERWADGCAILTWRPPKLRPGESKSRQISRYALEVSAAGDKGTFGPFREIWVGTGLRYPGRTALERSATGSGKSSTSSIGSGKNSRPTASRGGKRTRTKMEIESEITDAPEPARTGIIEVTDAGDDDKAGGESAATNMASQPAVLPSGAAKRYAATNDDDDDDSNSISSGGRGSRGPDAKMAVEKTSTDEASPLAYALAMPFNVTAKVRLRCWSLHSPIPSEFTAEVYVKPVRSKRLSATEASAISKRQGYLLANGQQKRPADVQPWGYENGGARVRWDPGALHNVLYDVPVPPSVPGMRAAGDAIAQFYTSLGVAGGGDGVCFGMRIDHVLHVAISTATMATLEQPLMCLLEVAYAHALLPLVDTVTVLRAEWQFAMEKVGGIVSQLLSFAQSYDRCEAHCRVMLSIAFELFETFRLCNPGFMLALHLGDKHYGKAGLEELKGELEDRIVDELWRLSAELLRVQVHLTASADGGVDDISDLSHLDSMQAEHDAMRMQLISQLGGHGFDRKKKALGARASGALMKWIGVHS